MRVAVRGTPAHKARGLPRATAGGVPLQVEEGIRLCSTGQRWRVERSELNPCAASTADQHHTPDGRWRGGSVKLIGPLAHAGSHSCSVTYFGSHHSHHEVVSHPARKARQLPLPGETITNPEAGLGYSIERTPHAAWDDHDDAMVATEVLLASRPVAFRKCSHSS